MGEWLIKRAVSSGALPTESLPGAGEGGQEGRTVGKCGQSVRVSPWRCWRFK